MSLQPGRSESEELIHQAIDEGINYFDTADLYDKGENEKLLGRALKGKRSKIVLATKAGNEWREDGSGWDWNPRKEYILSAVEKSLQRLQTDYIDLYQLHGGTMDDPMEETIEAFELLKDQGKIRYYGISSIRPNVIREWVSRSAIVSIMMQYSLLDRRPEEATLPLLKQKNIGVLARGSIAQGLLIDKPAKSYLEYSEKEVMNAKEVVHSTSNQQRSLVQTAIQFVLHQAAITSAVVGMRTKEQLREAIGVFDSILTAEELDLLQKALPLNFYQQHR
jgi:aryl-alcohol dehydrogenase-like predicted oxidoreductase